MTKPYLAAAALLLALQAGAHALEPHEVSQAAPGAASPEAGPASPRATDAAPMAGPQARLAFSLIERMSHAKPPAPAFASPASLASVLSSLAPGSDASMRDAIASTLGYRDPAKADLESMAAATLPPDGPARMAVRLILPAEPPRP